MTITESFKRLASKMLSKPVDQVEGDTISEVIDYTADNYVSDSGGSGGTAYDDTQVKDDITNLQNTKVDKIDGKGLSTNDFTDELKAKVESSSGNGLDSVPEYGLGQMVKNGKLYKVNFLNGWTHDNVTSTAILVSGFRDASITKVMIPKEVTIIASSFDNGLTDVYYEGTEEEWNTAVSVSSTGVDNATKHFNWDRNKPIPIN